MASSLTHPAAAEPVDRAGVTSVYRYYDGHGILLYAGITRRGTSRNFEHSSFAVWWRYVVSQEVEHYPTRVEALAREKDLILLHRPPFNVQHNPGAQLTRAAYLAFAEADAGATSALAIYKQVRRRLPLDLHEPPRDGVLQMRTRLDHHKLASVVQIPEQSQPRVIHDGQIFGKLVKLESNRAFLICHLQVRKEVGAPESASLVLKRVNKPEAYLASNIQLSEVAA